MFRAIIKFFKVIFALIFIVIIIAALTAGYAKFIEPNRLVTTDLNYHHPKIKDEVRIAVFADTHFGFDYDLEDFQKVIDKVNADPPDILLFGGDLIDNLNHYNGSTTEISAALSQLKAKSGKYAVFGNHDYGGGAEYKYKDIMKAGGFKVLVNETQSFDQFNFRLIGIDDMVIGYGNPEAANKAPSDQYNFVLCHEPDVIDQISNHNVQYMVAGHTHAGQIRIPIYTNNFLPPYGEKYVKGEYNANNILLYVNAGLGTTKIPARLLAPPELTYITISPQ